MREIKFRVWDKKGNPAQMYIDPFLGSPPTNLKLSEIMNELKDDGWIWMQYTGLKDKNGKEIYEGDILENKWGRWMIKFHNGGWKLKQETSLIEYDSLVPGGTIVIGNEYENPELLEDE